MELRAGNAAELIDNSRLWQTRGARAALLVTAPRGTYVFMKYPSPVPFVHQLAVTGKAGIQGEPGGATRTILARPGLSLIVIAGGSALPECIESAEQALAVHADDLLARTRAWWRGFTAHRGDLGADLPADTPLRGELIAAADDVAVIIKAQQGLEGGILAGMAYHWAAFRDQFGALRCLLALGHTEEAAQVLRYYDAIFRSRGTLHNGQDVGLNGFFHVHENDEVEMTGSLLTQAFDYRDATGNDELLRGFFPMLEWAFDAQVRHVRRHMVPFNGDETYIAGGMLPRGAINDGSAESTLLFITSGERFLSWTAAQGLWPAARLAEAGRVVAETRAHFRSCFWRDGALLTNNPGRMMVEEMPRFRHGVCESGAYVPECSGLRCQGGTIGWVERGDDGHYQCPACRARGVVLPAGRPVYHLASVSLVPLYLGSDLLSREEVTGAAAGIVSRYERTGLLTTTEGGTGTVGYDFGLLLFTLTVLGHPLAERVYRHMMSVRDSAGAWVEYYRDGEPVGCPCRPYESGINMEAALRFARSTARPAAR
jgi:hypothetical protein